ncbi:adhesion G protein-coupled receptor E1-like isoform X1 [Scyliorhinus canicula]|uniref:adhesion G protein-coupled receptor E1-like isoform X1 n=1 Tax=Scyliorhinus canicula TaxID=7830 RepID=UPI0018F6924C|nr:adhesion G protein-coupled receptor E1-like isoform X1 [Scyliorhinus canicula]
MECSWRLPFLVIYFCSDWNQRCSPGTAYADRCPAKLCGPNAVCHHTSGSFYCTCEKGYYSTEEKIFARSAEASCKDYDECRNIRTVCGTNASCHNTAGGFYCLCHRGFARESGETNFTGFGAGCKDIDECLQDPCGPDTVCQNINGSFHCIPNSAFILSTQTESQSAKLTCLANLLKNQSIIDKCYSQHSEGSQQIAADQFCSLIEPTLTFAEGMCPSELLFKKANKDVMLNNVLNFGNQFVNESSVGKKEDSAMQLQSTSLFLDAMESFTIQAALASPHQRIKTIITPYMDLDVQVIPTHRLRSLAKVPDRITLRAKENTMEAYLKTVTQENPEGSAAIAFISYNELNSLRNADFIEKENPRPYQLISGVVSATISNHKGRELSEQVNITLKHKKGSRADGRPVCVYWSHTKGRSYWSPEGCGLINSNVSHTACGCQHLSSFAILMTAVEDESHLDQNLGVITLVGISVSLACLGLAIITFRFCTQVTSYNNTIHINLCITLFLAELIFLVGINRTDNKVVCGIIAGSLHYLFLAAFAWMCVEGIYLHLMVRNLQKINNNCAQKMLKWFMYPFGYGVPAVIVVVSTATRSAGYGTHQHCWLTIENGFIWSFIGPVCATILFNTVLFAVTLWILRAQLTRLNAEVTKLKDMRMLTLKAIAQVFILGCTWILGLFHFQSSTLVMAYLFTIVNSFQGVFIFIILCLLNRQVRDGYRAWFNRLCMIRKKASFADSGSASVPMTTATERI